MMKFTRLLVKILLSIFLGAFIVIVSTVIYISINQKELTEKFLSAVEKEVALDLNYTSFRLSVIDHFPFAAFTFENLEVSLKGTGNKIPVLTAQNLSLTINTLNLIQGKFNVRNCIIENGITNYYPSLIDSILNEYSNPSQSNENVTNFNLNKFILKNYEINIYDDLNKQSVKLIIDNSFIELYIDSGITNAYIKTKLNKIQFPGYSVQGKTTDLEIVIVGNEKVYSIEKLRLNINKIGISATGTINNETGRVGLKFTSNLISTQNLFELIPIKSKNIELRGKTNFSGSLDYNIKTNKLAKITINHSSRGQIIIDHKVMKINTLDASTTFTNNFNFHQSTIRTINFVYKNFNASLSAKIKGITNPAILLDGEIGISDYKLNFFDKSVTINGKGNIKTLINTLKTSDNSASVKFHGIKGILNFDVSDITGLDRISNISGNAVLDKNVIINTTGYFDNSPFHLTINQSNILSILNNDSQLKPSIDINAETLDVDYIAKLIVSDHEKENSSPNNYNYDINVLAKSLRFMSYNYANVTSSMALSNDLFEIKSFSGDGFDGNINGSLKIIDNKYFISTNFNKINISKLFSHYNNFEQSLVSYSNISGSLSGSALLSFNADNKGKIEYPSLKLDSDVTISDGKLTGMNKIEKLSKWLKLDQVESIDFKTLSNRIEINNQCVRIPKMEVLSNVINFQLSGDHYFSGNYIYWMRINFSQVLSRRFLNTSNDNTNSSSDGSINLYLKLLGDSNNYEIKRDKKSSFENVSGNNNITSKSVKEIFREELNQIIRKDTILNSGKDNTPQKDKLFTIEWDEYDTLKVDNN